VSTSQNARIEQQDLALWYLTECYYKAGKFAGAKKTPDDLLDPLAIIRIGLKHPLHPK